MDPDLAEQFVRKLYRVLLLREPDSDGLAHWVSSLLQVGPQGFSDLVEAFADSDEFQAKLQNAHQKSVFSDASSSLFREMAGLLTAEACAVPLSHVYLSSDGQSMGERLEENVAAARHCFPGCRQVVYRFEDCRDFLRDAFPSEVLNAFDSLIPFAYKADLVRYCLLYVFGGWYIDVGLRCVGREIVMPAHVDFLAFRDRHPSTKSSYACANGAIFGKKGHPAFVKAIELVVQNVNRRYRGVSPLCPTGPNLWGRAIAMTELSPSSLFGDFVELTPAMPFKNKAMLMPDGSLLAHNKVAEGGDLASLGALGTNNYAKLWYAGEVYA